MFQQANRISSRANLYEGKAQLIASMRAATERARTEPDRKEHCETPGSRIRVLVAANQLVARAGVKAIVNHQPDMVVVAEAVSGVQAVQRFRRYLPDVTLLDMRMPVMSGIETVTRIRAEFPAARLIALTSEAGDEDVRRALAAGVHAYLTKNVLRNELLETIRIVHAGETYLPAALAAALEAKKDVPILSEREIEVLELVGRGMANKQIAHALEIAESTARNHVKHILTKLGVHDRTLATITALQRGIIHLGFARHRTKLSPP